MKLHYQRWGEGPPVVILHGLFGSSDNWRTISKRLSNDFQVFAVDQRNHGRSPHSENHSYPLMVSDLHAFCEEQKLTRSHFIGHSMGGKTAMQFALSFPQLVDRLVIVDINPFRAKGHHYHILEALGQINPAQLSSLKEAEAILTKSLKDKALCMFLLKNLKRSRQAGYEWKMNLKAITRHYNKIMPGIRGKSFYGPVLFIRGKNSPYIQENDIKGIIDLFPSARIETVENAGHWLHWEKPDAFIRLASTFFKSSKN